MSDFVETAIASASNFLDSAPSLNYSWRTSDSGAEILSIEPVGESGFPVELVFEEYGVYPYAGDWHGAPWDSGRWDGERLAKAIEEFLKSVYSADGYLDVYYVSGRPIRLILHHRFEGVWVNDETGLIFFNWFGKRSRQRLSNAVGAGD